MAHNLEHGITPRGVQKSIDQVRFITRVADARDEREAQEAANAKPSRRSKKQQAVAEAAAAKYDTTDIPALIAQLEAEMKQAAKDLDFETAARLRDELFELRAVSDDAPGAGGAARRRGTVGDLRARR